MPTLRARLTRSLIRHVVRRKFERAGRSIEAWRELEGFLIRSQRVPKGTVVSPVSAGGCTAEWVRGPGAGYGAAILYLHGGAFIMGSPATHRELAARISSASRVPVLSLDYRLAPEHPFPAAMDDAKSAYHWLLAQDYPPTGIVVCGDSAGGGVALQALLSLRDEGAQLPAAIALLSPVADWVGLDGESYSSRAGVDPMVSPAHCRFTADLYAGGRGKDPLLRPIDMDLGGLPPVWIHVGDLEVLLSDSERLAHRAQEAGVEVEFRVWPGLWHVFQTTAGFVPEARGSLEDLGRFVRSAVKDSSTHKPGG